MVFLLIDFIMLCETFLFDLNQDMFPLPVYKIVCNNRKQGQRGGVAIYTRDIFQHKLHDDLTMNYNDVFESIFIEIDDNMHKVLIGEIYRVPGTSGGMNQHLESGNRGKTNLESGIEAQKIWNLGTEKISGIWDLGILGIFC